ncbi:DeoR/GlpR family DNA-binding transcription regulator [Pseudogracilibacillus auburnensis]|uniref:DeoR/GlpR family DNA-binding transcription regulator n=1 Tax=Pseudogracilibacillus auburnensis TaxID=1494959 RepID=UPI001A95E892|nr:DeoR/GlpR family DNA-binding transcription regulator [Pseudogracilibacillus auburnensis]MBO1001830.1 DeoR/GlpR transcriptional regulator [Pseudogracilibacillus auburnensis]
MLAQERYRIILEMLEVSQIVKVPELCERFNVSIETVRRDLEFLEQEGKLKRVYGGAVLNRQSSAEPSYNTRSTRNAAEKAMIGKKTAELISDGETLMIDLGTTTLEVARYLKDKKNLTIITNCMTIAQELVDVSTFRVILPGGILRPNELALSGFISEQFMREFNVDKTIIGVGGITKDNGISDYHLEETRVRKIMIEKGKQIIAVADHSKFGIKALVNVCSIDEIDTIVTNDKLKSNIAQEYIEQGIKVIGYGK